MHLYIDTLAYTNRLRYLPPAHKLLFAIIPLFIAFISHAPVQLAVIIWMTIWTIGYARIPVGVYLKMIAGAGVFLLMSLPALMLNLTSISEMPAILSDRWIGIEWGNWYFYISHTGTQQALSILLRSLAGVCCLFFILLTIPFVEILQVLRRLGCPTLLTELLLLMYRFIFVLLQTADELWIAQQARNGHRSWSITMRSLTLLIGQLLQRTLERYRQYSFTLASRGFTGDFQVWHPQRTRPSRRYILEASLGCITLLGLEMLTGYR